VYSLKTNPVPSHSGHFIWFSTEATYLYQHQGDLQIFLQSPISAKVSNHSPAVPYLPFYSVVVGVLLVVFFVSLEFTPKG
jgi:hypothetical protein